MKEDKDHVLILDYLIQMLGDAGRLIADSFFNISKTRKYFVAQGPKISKLAKTLIDESVSDKYLLGADWRET